MGSHINYCGVFFLFFCLLDKGNKNKTEFKCRVPSCSSISTGLNSLLELQNLMDFPGNLFLKTPGAPPGGSSSFPKVFSPRLLGVKNQIISSLNSSVCWNPGSEGWEKQNSSPKLEEFPGWKVEFPFLRYFPHLKMQHFYIHHPGGERKSLQIELF